MFPFPLQDGECRVRDGLKTGSKPLLDGGFSGLGQEFLSFPLYLRGEWKLEVFDVR
jgi:hypothetical protein